MKHPLYLLIALSIALVACNDSTQEKDLRKRQQLLNQPELFSVFDRSNLSQNQRDALTILYSYMPLPDLTDYSADFFLANVDYTLKAQEEMPWGDIVPKTEWQHFVLPLRVNNEPLDSSRIVLYRTLKPRVEQLSMEEAILEVNHFCHEHVSYQPSDGRTSSPLQSMKSAIGRCGEESTFLVAALRAVGIPARQVYTPRWAHTDDNHAWVEAWANGKWHFLGACEPEPVLDLGWFNEPASRGLIMHANVSGHYYGPEMHLKDNIYCTKILVTDNYAPVGMNTVQVVDTNGQPVADARIRFCIYNYAEFYPVLDTLTNSQGTATLLTGYGDMVVWAAKDSMFGFVVNRPSEEEVKTLVLDHKMGEPFSADLTITPPVAHNNLPPVTPEAREQCNQRLSEEDAIRNAYIATFDYSSALMAATRGNHEVIRTFLEETNNSPHAWTIVNHLCDKDKRDITLANLRDVYQHTAAYDPQGEMSYDMYYQYVVQPRVQTEALTPYRGALLEAIPAPQQKAFRSDIQSITRWIRDSVRIDNQQNPQGLKMAPLSVWKYRITDSGSRNLFFVCMARTFGYPAEINPITGELQYWTPQGWTILEFEDKEAATVPSVKLILSPASNCHTEAYHYYSHFSICQLHQMMPRQLEYSETATLSEMVSDNIPLLSAGDYLLVTGSRLANGAVLVHLEGFSVSDSQAEVVIPITFRQTTEEVMVIGSFNSENRYLPYYPNGAEEPSSTTAQPTSEEPSYASHQSATSPQPAIGELCSILSTTGRGYYICGLIAPNNEPSTHMLHDLEAAREELNRQGISIVLLFPSEASARKFRFEEFPNLPDKVSFGIANESTINDLRTDNDDSTPIPTIIIADTFNRVVFRGTGYTIGLGFQLLDCLRKL